MAHIVQTQPPKGSLIDERAVALGYYADAFCVDVVGEISINQFVEAFYTTPLFKAERLILRVFAGAGTTDAQAASVAAGTSQKFAVWTQEAHTANEMLMDAGSTKSWFCTEPIEAGTRLWFGSVVMPRDPQKGPEMGFGFRALLGAHVFYSHLLLKAAARRLSQA